MTLVLVFVAVAAAAAHQAFTRAVAMDGAAGRLASVAASAAQADLALVEAAASQRGYVAPGQGIDFWSARADASLASARAAMTSLQAGADDLSAAAMAGDALSRLDDFAVIDQRAREHVGAGQRAMASDLIFADGYEVIASARAELASAAALERDAITAPLARDRQIRTASLGALAACAGVALLLLLRAPRPVEPVVTSLGSSFLADAAIVERTRTTERAVDDDAIGAALDASLESLNDFAPALPVEPTEPMEPAEPALPALPAIDLSSAADVCVDLGRLLDARDLQPVLARIASVIGANGLIVWMADDVRGALAPALTHGYAPSLIARLGPLPADDDNATAAAWRSKTTQIVNGAIAVPLLTSEGCTGVLAVELPDGRERERDVESLARILAAQLAASIAPAATESRRAAEG